MIHKVWSLLRRERFEEKILGPYPRVNEWNAWRARHPSKKICLRHVILNNFAETSSLARTRSAFDVFQRKSLCSINLSSADLQGAKIWKCDLNMANLRNADLGDAEIRYCDLECADLSGANLERTQFLLTNVRNARFDNAQMRETHFGFTPLPEALGIEHITDLKTHLDYFSEAGITLPESVYTVVGTSNKPSITLSRPDSQYLRCFISYSRRDEAVAILLRDALLLEGVPVWFAPNDLRRRYEGSFDPVDLQRDLTDFIDVAERVIALISPHILSSAWVAEEHGRATMPVIPVLLADMPQYDSERWHAAINKMAAHLTTNSSVTRFQSRRDGHLMISSPDVYSQKLGELLSSRQLIDLRGRTDKECVAAALPLFLTQLRRRN